MTKLGTWKRPTPFKKQPTGKSRRFPIIIPQPIKQPFYIKGKDVIDWEGLRNDPTWYTLHRRSPQEKIEGYNPLEERAVPDTQRKGSLPERIVYKYLTKNLKMVEDIDFDFQGAQEGGRTELGGFVADFVFQTLKLVIQVQGVWHKEYLQARKDEQQRDVLAEFGYWVEYIWEEEIYDEYRFESRMRKIFNLASASGSAFGSNVVTHDTSPATEPDAINYNEWLQLIAQIKIGLEAIV